jgi:hypothetical protein
MTISWQEVPTLNKVVNCGITKFFIRYSINFPITDERMDRASACPKFAVSCLVPVCKSHVHRGRSSQVEAAGQFSNSLLLSIGKNLKVRSLPNLTRHGVDILHDTR